MRLATFWKSLCRHSAAVGFTLVFLAALASATLLTLEAFEERSASLAVTDMRIAVLALLDIDETATLSPDDKDRVVSALDVLSTERAEALHAIATDQVDLFDRELALIEAHGQALLMDVMDHEMVHSVIVHETLEKLLRDGSIAAAGAAGAAERRAGIAAAVAVASLLALGVTFVKSLATRQRHDAQAAADQNASKRLQSVLDNSLNSVLIIDQADRVSYRSLRFTSLFGADIETLPELAKLFEPAQREALRNHVHGSTDVEDELALTSTLSDPQGRCREFIVRVANHEDDSVIDGRLVTLVEMTAANQAKARLVELASRDPLTGLPNRRALMESLETAAASPRSLLMIDLDDFKGTNDSHGHDAGDELLCAVAGRFARACPEGALFRLGGDEFAVLVEETNETKLDQLGHKLVGSLNEPVELVSGFEEVAASVGIARQTDQSPAETLLRRADIALYAAKRDDGLNVVVLTDDVEEQSTSLRTCSRALHHASLDDEFRLVYQPIVDSATGEVAFVEALLRWKSPALGFVPPDVFIPIAERSGRIVQIGQWVLEQAVAQLRTWDRMAPGTEFGLTVNVSPRQLVERGFAENVLAILRANDVPTHRLIIEITESALVAPGAHDVEALVRLREAGCQIACDDFGAGYSNLGQLMTLPLDIIKVDRDLLVHLSDMREAAGSTEPACAVMAAIASIGGAMHAPIVAEGVETEMQANSLRASGVAYMQGYYFSRPVESDEILGLLLPLRVGDHADQAPVAG